MARRGWNPAQPRDASGRWSSGGAPSKRQRRKIQRRGERARRETRDLKHYRRWTGDYGSAKEYARDEEKLRAWKADMDRARRLNIGG